MRDPLSPWTISAFAILLAGALASCGGNDIVFGQPGDDDDDETETVTVKGTIDDVFPVASRDIVVFAFNIDEEDYRCPCPDDPSTSTRGKAVVLEPGETEFTISGLDRGPIGIVFLQDNPGDAADGEIDDGDPIAIMDDVDCEMDDDVEANTAVTLEDVDIWFDSDPVVDPPLDQQDLCKDPGDLYEDDPPVPGRARANEITRERVQPSN